MKSFTTLFLLALAATTTTMALPSQQPDRRDACNGAPPPAVADITASPIPAAAPAAAPAAIEPATDASPAPPTTNENFFTAPQPGFNNAAQNGFVNTALIPPFGVTANTNPSPQQPGACDGFNSVTNADVLIPCNCPPSQADFVAALARNVQSGKVRFDNDATDMRRFTTRQRGDALMETLQDTGCPAASAPNFAIMQRTGRISGALFVGPGAAA